MEVTIIKIKSNKGYLDEVIAQINPFGIPTNVRRHETFQSNFEE